MVFVKTYFLRNIALMATRFIYSGPDFALSDEGERQVYHESVITLGHIFHELLLWLISIQGMMASTRG